MTQLRIILWKIIVSENTCDVRAWVLSCSFRDVAGFMVQSKQKRFTFESLSKSFTKFRIEFGFSFCTNSCIPTLKISGARTLNENWWFVCGQNMFSNQHIKSFFYKSQGSYNIYTQKPVINVNRFLLFVFVCHQTLDKADIQPHGAYYTTWCIRYLFYDYFHRNFLCTHMGFGWIVN